MALVAVAGIAAVVSHGVHAQQYPTKPIRLIVPNAPGGGTDTVARAISEKLSPALGQQIVVDNRGGAGGRIAAELVARSPKDGYTLLLGSAATLISGPALDRDRKYDPVKDFAPISLAGTTAYMLVVHPALPAKSVKELIALAKAKPGHIAFASTGQGGPAHLGAELLQAMAQVKLIHVPFKGGSPAMLSLLQGETQMMIANFLTALPAVRAQRVRALGVTSPKRSALAPDIPTIDEAGLRGFELQQLYSLVAPGGTPAPIVERLNRQMVERYPAEDVRQRLANEGVEVVTSTPADAARIYAEQFAKWSRVVRDAGIKIDR
ncbi:MAG TPA: tripartite tricarboxylate transporter substrate binding protein [Burkholderiales bacterium]|nr:tripartite tricarboxylate transporter substrate binding protein [Burkholderiales bacterium]